jgi:hypothetical protein
MSRFHPERDITALLKAAETWRDRCLIEDSSVFDITLVVWTLNNARRNFIAILSNDRRREKETS